MSISSKISSSPPVIRIGFDLDGVLLQNPSRILRHLISKGKQAHLLPRKELEFYHPGSTWERWLWLLVHKTSWRLAPGFAELEQLATHPQLEFYVVSARFACLQSDTKRWLPLLNRRHTFRALYFNDHDEQPHLFKQKMTSKLQLDYFVEDNWDVVSYLAAARPQMQVWWLSNLLDRYIAYPHKFFDFRAVVQALRGLV